MSVSEATQERQTVRWRHVAAYYVMVPLLTAVIFGINHSGMARYLPVEIGIPYWAGIMIPFWLTLDIATRVSARALEPWRPQPWLVLVFGAIAAMLVFAPYVQYYAPLFTPLLAEGRTYEIAGPPWEAIDSLERLIGYSGVPIYWVVVNLLFLRLTGYPEHFQRGSSLRPQPKKAPSSGQPVDRERVSVVEGAPVHAAANRPAPPPFMALVPKTLGAEFLLLQAEDHYVRVHTALGNALIRYRFSTAIDEARPFEGLQVHRSYWVRRSAIQRIESEGKIYRLILSDGKAVPVSRSFVGALKVAGLI
jgi:hypothetical protein